MKHLWKNFTFLCGEWRKLPIKKTAWLYFFLYFLFGSVVAVLAVLVPSRAVVSLQNFETFLPFLGLVAALGIALFLQNILQNETYMLSFLFRLLEAYPAAMKPMLLPAEQMEGPKGKEQRNYISAAVYWGNELGVEGFMTNIRDIVANLINTLIYILLSARLEWKWLPLILLPAVGQGIMSLIFMKQINEKNQERQNLWAEGHYMQSIALKNEAAKDVRLYPIVDIFKKKYLDLRKRWHGYVSGKQYRLFAADASFWLLSIARDVIVFIVLFRRVQAGMPVSDFVLYMGVILGISAYVSGIFNKIALLFQNNFVVTHFREAMQQPEYDQTGTPGLVPQGLGTIRFENVSYSYSSENENTKWALKNINLTIKPGEKIALVGENGAGKTTLVKLATGIFTPTRGEIYYDGINVKEFKPTELYKKVAMVFQNVTIIATTLAENITCQPESEIDYERLKWAIEKAGLSEVVARLSEGVHSQLTTYLHKDGVNLSGGENQRLMLARALYKGGDILILDEPTAALDPLAEAALYERYHELAENQTAVFISHRLSSTQFCDRVVFLKEGEIVETGTHASLMEAKGAYQHMFHEQAKYYQTEAAL